MIFMAAMTSFESGLTTSALARRKTTSTVGALLIEAMNVIPSALTRPPGDVIETEGFLTEVAAMD
jgi:hypothetical protein